MAYILMKEKTGYGPVQEGEDQWTVKVFKGELVVPIPQEEMRQISQIKGVTPNYRLHRDPQIILYGGSTDFTPLDDKEIEYLQAINIPGSRLKEYLNEVDKKMKMDLVVGDKVIFKLKLPESSASKPTPTASVNGTIRYIGHHPDSDGIVFGIEIQDQRYHGKGTGNGDPYFCCGSKDAVFVSMDMITKKSQYPIDEKPAPAKSAYTSKPTSRNLTSTSGSDVKGKGEAVDVRGTRTDPNHQSKFKVGDHVIVKSVRDEVFYGTVKWVGTTRVRNEGDRYSTVVAVVGVDVEKKILSIDRHFPGMYIDITGSRGQEVFKVGFGHTRLFFPEEFGVVLHVEEYAKQRQEARALKWELEEAKKYGLSLEEYRSQEKYIEKAKLANKDNEQENHPWQTGGGQEEEGAAAGVGPFGKNKESEKDKMSEAIMHVSTSEPLSEGRRQQEERAYELARQQSQHGGGDPTGYEVIKRGEVKPTDDNYSDVEPYHTVPEDHQQDVSPVSQGSQKPSLKAHHEEGYKSLSSYNTHHPYSPNLRHSPDPPADYRGGNHQGYNCDNQYRGHHDPPGHHDRRDPSHDPHHQFTVGSMVRVVAIQRGDPLYGVVQWIGILPDYPGTIAGVELEKTINGGTDGTRGGRRFFTCPYGKGYFCPLNTLKQDTRYMDEGQVPAHMRQDIDNLIKDSNKEEMIKLKEEIHQLQRSIENLQLKKDTQQRTAKQQAEREKEQWKNDKQQLLEEQEHLREEIKEKLETDKERLREENGQLKYEIERLRREIIDLREAHRELQEETEKKEQVQAQLQSQVGLFSIENMRLKGQVKQLEEISATDIKYWEVSYKQVLTNKDTLGSGGWGKVEVGLLHGQKVAMKMLHSDIKSPYYNQLVRREISMLAKVRHPNLLLFIAGVLDHPSGSPIIITELLDTSLRKAYTDRLIGSDRVRISIMRDIAAALNYIHRQKESIIHRDVSSANVLLESRGEGNWKAKLSDFGSANLVQFSTTVGPGAIPYAAPEVPHNQTTKMDVYSYGVLLCEVMLSEFPFKERFPDMLQSLAGSWSLMYQLILSCTRHSVTDRVDMMYVLDTFNESFTDVSVKGFVPLV